MSAYENCVAWIIQCVVPSCGNEKVAAMYSSRVGADRGQDVT